MLEGTLKIVWKTANWSRFMFSFSYFLLHGMVGYRERGEEKGDLHTGTWHFIIGLHSPSSYPCKVFAIPHYTRRISGGEDETTKVEEMQVMKWETFSKYGIN